MGKELLFSVTKKDLKISWFSGKGAGGQHRNKHQNCCRIKHLDSGVTATGQETRSREQNLRNAFKRLAKHPDFEKWLRRKVSEVTMDKVQLERRIQLEVDNAMKPENLKIEYYNAGLAQ